MGVSIPPAPKGADIQDVFERMDGFRNPQTDTSKTTETSHTLLLAFACVMSAAGCMLLIISLVVFCSPSAPLSGLVIEICNNVFKGA